MKPEIYILIYVNRALEYYKKIYGFRQYPHIKYFVPKKD